MRIRARFGQGVSDSHERGVWRRGSVAGCCSHVAPRYSLRDTRATEKEAARDDSSDDDWDPDEAAGASDEEDSDADDKRVKV